MAAGGGGGGGVCEEVCKEDPQSLFDALTAMESFVLHIGRDDIDFKFTNAKLVDKSLQGDFEHVQLDHSSFWLYCGKFELTRTGLKLYDCKQHRICDTIFDFELEEREAVCETLQFALSELHPMYEIVHSIPDCNLAFTLEKVDTVTSAAVSAPYLQAQYAIGYSFYNTKWFCVFGQGKQILYYNFFTISKEEFIQNVDLSRVFRHYLSFWSTDAGVCMRISWLEWSIEFFNDYNQYPDRKLRLILEIATDPEIISQTENMVLFQFNLREYRYSKSESDSESESEPVMIHGKFKFTREETSLVCQVEGIDSDDFDFSVEYRL